MKVLRDITAPVSVTVLLLCLFLGGVFSLGAQDGTSDEDALLQYRQGNYDRAIEITQRELQQDPERVEAYIVMAWSYLAQERYTEALSTAADGMQVSRYDHRLLFVAGEANFELENDAEAITYFQDYLAVNPEGRRRSQVYFYLGEIFLRIGEYHHADIAFSTALHDTSESPERWLQLGEAREEAGNFQLAYEAYEQALRMDPELVSAEEGMERVSDQL